MLPWLHLDTAPLPDGRALRLMQRGEQFVIRLGQNDLMNSRLVGSEEALARLAAERLGARLSPEVLIGGLGMGFTLRAALAALGPTARVTVAELVPQILAWARGPLAALYAGSLDDPRVTIQMGDVRRVIEERVGAFDAILLDVDNGPEGLTVAGNDALYGAAGLGAARAALRPGGILAIWSAAPDDAFAARLRRGGFSVEEVRVRAAGKRGPRNIIWLARRNAAPHGRGRSDKASDGPAVRRRALKPSGALGSIPYEGRPCHFVSTTPASSARREARSSRPNRG